MKKFSKILLFFLALTKLFLGYYDLNNFLEETLNNIYNENNKYSNYKEIDKQSSSNSLLPINYNKEILYSLNNIDIFESRALNHIFNGQINSKGMAVGYHYEGLFNSSGKIIADTYEIIDNFGVYVAKVEINNIKKVSNNGISSFFPRTWSPQMVIDCINEAYYNRSLVDNNKYIGFSSKGMAIEMYLHKDNKILTAYPKVYTFNRLTKNDYTIDI